MRRRVFLCGGNVNAPTKSFVRLLISYDRLKKNVLTKSRQRAKPPTPAATPIAVFDYQPFADANAHNVQSLSGKHRQLHVNVSALLPLCLESHKSPQNHSVCFRQPASTQCGALHRHDQDTPPFFVHAQITEVSSCCATFQALST